MQQCSHCGDSCENSKIKSEEHLFCCTGCKTVFELLNNNGLCDYYDNEENPGIKIKNVYTEKFDILDEIGTKKNFILFENQELTKAKFFLPQIHCSSCIWLLEHLKKLDQKIIGSEVNFQKKSILITFENTVSLKEVALLLTSIGYEPRLDQNDEKSNQEGKKLIYKIGVAGFCFGNIMLFAFPEYLGLEEERFSQFFGWTSMALSIPVVFYSGFDYVRKAILGIRQRQINMDIPIAIGIITLFVRSILEVISKTGVGYFDSLSGLIFFLLIGKWFQEKTYGSLSFERTYKSYFPLSVSVVRDNNRKTTKLEDLKIGDEVIIKNQEIIPADCILKKGNAAIDYSFVTGESDLITINLGEGLFAGGRHNGQEITVILTHKPDNSYLTQLWNKTSNEKDPKSVTHLADQVSHYFTIIILLITLATFAYWFFTDYDVAWSAVSAVLIVACPCALALTIPFTLGNSMRFLGRKGIYLKNSEVLETLSKIDNVVFDKTGTLTQAGSKNIVYHNVESGMDPNKVEQIIKSTVMHSSHPLSAAISKSLKHVESIPLDSFEEISGKGLKATLNELNIFIGNTPLVNSLNHNTSGSKVGIVINEILVGYYTLTSSLRSGVKNEIDELAQAYNLSLISGDNDKEDSELFTDLKIQERKYNLSPSDKLEHIEAIQSNGKKAVMIGDGLNDAGALMQSDVGIAVSDDVNYFVPACDIIINAKSLINLSELMDYANISMKIIWTGFILSFIYNIIGLSFAVSGNLSPIIAAILMPLSSISIVAFTSLSTRYYFNKKFQNKN